MTSAPTAGRAFRALVWFTARRHAKVRQLGWVSFGLLALVAGIVALLSSQGGVWRLETRTRTVGNLADEKNPHRMTHRLHRLIFESIGSCPESIG